MSLLMEKDKFRVVSAACEHDIDKRDAVNGELQREYDELIVQQEIREAERDQVMTKI